MSVVKRICGILLVVLMAFSLASCEFLNQLLNENEKITLTPEAENNYEVDNEFVKVTSTYGYDNLQNHIQKDFYNAILANVEKVTDEFSDGVYSIESIKLDYSNVDVKDIDYAYTAVLSDHPEIFWVSNNYVYAISDYYAVLELKSCFSKTEVEEMSLAIQDKVDEIISNIPGGLSNYEIELYIHNYLIDNCSYFSDYIQVDASGNLYDCLIEGKTICSGYTGAFQYLLNHVGIDCVSILGWGQNMAHIWNAVLLDNQWYYVDVTWDDSNELSRYNYFNITEKQLLNDHKIYEYFSDSSDYNLIKVACYEDEYNYFKYSAYQLTDLEDDNISYEIAQAYVNGEDVFYMYIDPDYLDFKDTVDKLLNGYYLSDYITSANYTYDVNISYEMKYIEAKNTNGFIFTLT